MKVVLGLAALVALLGVLETCDMTKRKATIAVFVSKKMRDSWINGKKFGTTDNDLKAGIKDTLIPAVNALYTRAKLTYAEVTFELVHTEVFSQAIDNAIARGNTNEGSLDPFCNYVSQNSVKAQVNLYIVDKTEQSSKIGGASGKAIYDGVCKKGGCAVIVGKYFHAGVGFPNLAAHEIGHLFSFRDLDRSCGGIMYSPADYDGWSTCTKEIVKDRFVTQKYEFVCLQNDCGQFPTTVKPTIPPGSVSEADKAVLSQTCAQWLGNPAYKYGALYTPGSDPGSINTNSMYGRVISANPKWYLASNVCFGIPCIRKKPTGGSSVGGIAGAMMNFRPCGVNKKCTNVVQGQRVVSATCG